jgi:hypothetical protein
MEPLTPVAAAAPASAEAALAVILANANNITSFFIIVLLLLHFEIAQCAGAKNSLRNEKTFSPFPNIFDDIKRQFALAA